ncbi:hypothetical protein ACOMHN_044288 [Nucella lapillus]
MFKIIFPVSQFIAKVRDSQERTEGGVSHSGRRLPVHPDGEMWEEALPGSAVLGGPLPAVDGQCVGAVFLLKLHYSNSPISHRLGHRAPRGLQCTARGLHVASSFIQRGNVGTVGTLGFAGV